MTDAAKRYQVCRLNNDGVYDPETEAIRDAEFDTVGEAMMFVGVFPGEGRGYIWDRQKNRVDRVVSWEREARAN